MILKMTVKEVKSYQEMAKKVLSNIPGVSDECKEFDMMKLMKQYKDAVSNDYIKISVTPKYISMDISEEFVSDMVNEYGVYIIAITPSVISIIDSTKQLMDNMEAIQKKYLF